MRKHLLVLLVCLVVSCLTSGAHSFSWLPELQRSNYRSGPRQQAASPSSSFGDALLRSVSEPVTHYADTLRLSNARSPSSLVDSELDSAETQERPIRDSHEETAESALAHIKDIKLREQLRNHLRTLSSSGSGSTIENHNTAKVMASPTKVVTGPNGESIVRRVLHLGVMIPCTNVNVCGLIGGAVELAIKQVNDLGILNDANYTLDYQFRDDQCSAGGSMMAAMQLYQSGVDVFIGPPCSVGTQPVVLLAQMWNLPVLGYAVIDDSLSDKSLYPNFARLCEPEAKWPGTTIALFKRMNWQHACILASTEDLWTLLLQTQLKILPQNGIQVLAVGRFIPHGDYTVAFSLMKQTGCRIILVNAYIQDFRSALVAAKDAGMTGDGYVYLGPQIGSKSWNDAYSPPDGRNLEARNVLIGSIAQSAGAAFGAAYVNFSQAVQAATPAFASIANPYAPFNISYPNGVLSPTYSQFLYDSVMFYAYLVAKAVKTGVDIKNAKEFLKLTPSITFKGMSGDVFFDSSYNRGAQVYTMYQFQDGVNPVDHGGDWTPITFVSNGTYYEPPSTSRPWAFPTCRVNYVFNTSTSPYPNGATCTASAFMTSMVPFDLLPPVAEVRSTSAAAVLYAAFGVAMLVSLTSTILTWLFRSKRVIKRYSPTFCAMSLMGITMCFVAGILLISEDTAANCTAVNWLFHVGFTLSFVSVTVRAYRVAAIFLNPLLIHLSMSDTVVGKWVVLTVLFDSILLSVWTGAAPYTVTPFPAAQCTYDSDSTKLIGTVVNWILIGSKIGYMAYACYLAFSVRDIPTKFSESHALQLVIYGASIVGIVVIGLSHGVSLSVQQVKLLWIVCILFVGVMMLFILFGSMLFYIYEDTKLSLSTNRKFTGSRGRTNSSHNSETNTSNLSGTGSSDRSGAIVMDDELIAKFNDKAIRQALVKLDEMAAELQKRFSSCVSFAGLTDGVGSADGNAEERSNMHYRQSTLAPSTPINTIDRRGGPAANPSVKNASPIKCDVTSSAAPVPATSSTSSPQAVSSKNKTVSNQIRQFFLNIANAHRAVSQLNRYKRMAHEGVNAAGSIYLSLVHQLTRLQKNGNNANRDETEESNGQRQPASDPKGIISENVTISRSSFSARPPSQRTDPITRHRQLSASQGNEVAVPLAVLSDVDVNIDARPASNVTVHLTPYSPTATSAEPTPENPDSELRDGTVPNTTATTAAKPSLQAASNVHLRPDAATAGGGKGGGAASASAPAPPSAPPSPSSASSAEGPDMARKRTRVIIHTEKDRM